MVFIDRVESEGGYMKYLLDNFHVDPNDSMASLRVAVSKRLNLPSSSLRIEILFRHLEWSFSSKKMEMVYDLCVETNEFIRDTTIRFLPDPETKRVKEYSRRDTPVIVGAGIIGLSAALHLARSGAKPIVLERGEEALNSNKTLQNDDRITCYGGYFGRNGATFVHDRTAISEDIFQRLVRAGRVQPSNKDRYLFLSPDDCVLITTSLINDIRNLGGQVLFGCEWIGCDYFLKRLKAVRYLQNNVEQIIKTKTLLLACGSIDPNTASCLQASKIEMDSKKNQIGIILEYPLSEYKAAFLKGARTTWPHFFIHETFKGKDGRPIHFAGPFFSGSIEPHGEFADNELRIALASSSSNSAIFTLFVNLTAKEARNLLGNDDSSPLFHMTYRKDKPYSVPVETVGDFAKKSQPWKLGRAKASYKKGIFMADLHSFLQNPISDSLQYGLVHIGRNYPLFTSTSGLVYGFMETAGSPIDIDHEEGYTNRRGVYAVSSVQNAAMNLNQSVEAGINASDVLLEKA